MFVTEQNCHRTIVAISKYWKCTAMKLLSQTTSANRTQTFTHFDFISHFSEIFVCIANCDVAETQNKSCKMTLLPIAGERITVMLGDFTALQIFSAGLLRCQSCADNEGIWGKQWKNEGEKGKTIEQKNGGRRINGRYNSWKTTKDYFAENNKTFGNPVFLVNPLLAGRSIFWGKW